MRKVNAAYAKMRAKAENGATPHVGWDGYFYMTVEVDNDEWSEFNREYYKLRKMD